MHYFPYTGSRWRFIAKNKGINIIIEPINKIVIDILIGIKFFGPSAAYRNPSVIYVIGLKRAMIATLGQTWCNLYQIKKIPPKCIKGLRIRSHVLLINQFHLTPKAKNKNMIDKNKDDNV